MNLYAVTVARDGPTSLFVEQIRPRAVASPFVAGRKVLGPNDMQSSDRRRSSDALDRMADKGAGAWRQATRLRLRSLLPHPPLGGLEADNDTQKAS